MKCAFCGRRMKTLKQRLEDRLKNVDPIILEIVLNPFLDETKSWLTQIREEKKQSSLTKEGFHTDYYHIKAALINELLEKVEK